MGDHVARIAGNTHANTRKTMRIWNINATLEKSGLRTETGPD